jgi:hypothetical protein
MDLDTLDCAEREPRSARSGAQKENTKLRQKTRSQRRARPHSWLQPRVANDCLQAVSGRTDNLERPRERTWEGFPLVEHCGVAKAVRHAVDVQLGEQRLREGTHIHRTSFSLSSENHLPPSASYVNPHLGLPRSY